MTEAVRYLARPDGIAVITIDRPEQRNCLSREVREGLFAAWDRFENDATSRIAILTGAGDKAFCAGGDLKEMVETGLQVPPRDMFPVPYENIKLSKPTIAVTTPDCWMKSNWRLKMSFVSLSKPTMKPPMTSMPARWMVRTASPRSSIELANDSRA